MEHEDSRLRWWDLSAAFLLVAALLTAATRLVATQWTANLSIVQTLVFFGVIAGLALGKSSFSHITVLTLGAVYGTFAIPWQLGLTLSSDLLWSERMLVLIDRLGVILFQLFNRDPVRRLIIIYRDYVHPVLDPGNACWLFPGTLWQRLGEHFANRVEPIYHPFF